MIDAELAILSLLSEGPSYDHDLNDTIEARGLRRWTAIGASSMYYVLDKLERQGLVEKTSSDYGHRRFQISQAGVGVLQTAIVDLLSSPHSYDKSFELGLANLHVLKSGQVRSALLGREQDLINQCNKLRKERENAAGNFQIQALFDHSIAMMEAELLWLRQFIVAWEAQVPAEKQPVITPNIAPRMKQVVLPQDPDSVHKHTTRDVQDHQRQTPTAHITPPPINKKADDQRD